MSEKKETRIYVPLEGTHVEPAPIYAYSARWYEERGLKLPYTKKERFIRFCRRLLRWRRK